MSINHLRVARQAREKAIKDGKVFREPAVIADRICFPAPQKLLESSLDFFLEKNATSLTKPQITDQERYQYIKATTTAVRDHVTGERKECTPEEFEQWVDHAIVRDAQK